MIYHPVCPGCEKPTYLFFGPQQAICNNPECHVLCWVPSAPDAGLANIQQVDLPIFEQEAPE